MKQSFIHIIIVLLIIQICNDASAHTLLNKDSSNVNEIYISSGNEKIFGILSKPSGTGVKQPIVIISHGFNGTHEFVMNYFKRINDMGYQCFAFDFPCGSIKSKSNNNTMEMSIIDEQQHLEAVINHFKSQPDVDTNRIILIGESQGGLVSALVAANNPTDIYRLILVFPALCIPDNWNERYKQIADIPDTTRIWNIPIGRRFFTEIRYMNPMDIIGKYERPVLIIHGDKDSIVPIEYSHNAYKVYKKAHLSIIYGEEHGFKPEGFEKSLDEIERFLLDKNLQ